MPIPAPIRSLLPLIVGLVVGGVGATLFLQSLPGSEGSPKERANQLEVELQRAKNRLAALGEGATGQDRASRALPANRGDARRTMADGARRIAEDLREGKPVSPEDIFRATQPLIRDLAPLFDRMRVKQQQQMVDGMTSELARKYHLTPEAQKSLKGWFLQRTDAEAKRWNQLLTTDGTRLEDLVRRSRDVRIDEGLETFMPTILSGVPLDSFQSDRMAERGRRIENEADSKVQRLDGIVGLNEAQRDQVFGIMARTSPDYDPAMVPQGVLGQIGNTPGGDRQTAILSVLRPDQQAVYKAEQQKRRDEATKNMGAMGLTLPASWEMLGEDNFR